MLTSDKARKLNPYFFLLACLFTVYNSGGYVDMVAKLAEKSMMAAVEEVKSLPDYATTGEVSTLRCGRHELIMSLILFKWVITDARHDSTANAYHTTVPCLAGR